MSSICPKCNQDSLLKIDDDNWCCQNVKCGERSEGFQRHIDSLGTLELTPELLRAKLRLRGDNPYYFEKALGTIVHMDTIRKAAQPENKDADLAETVAEKLRNPGAWLTSAETAYAIGISRATFFRRKKAIDKDLRPNLTGLYRAESVLKYRDAPKR